MYLLASLQQIFFQIPVFELTCSIVSDPSSQPVSEGHKETIPGTF